MKLKGNSTAALIVKLILTTLVIVGLIYLDESYCAATYGHSLRVYSTCYHMILGLGLVYYWLTLLGRLGAKVFNVKPPNKGNF